MVGFYFIMSIRRHYHWDNTVAILYPKTPPPPRLPNYLTSRHEFNELWIPVYFTACDFTYTLILDIITQMDYSSAHKPIAFSVMMLPQRLKATPAIPQAQKHWYDIKANTSLILYCYIFQCCQNTYIELKIIYIPHYTRYIHIERAFEMPISI